MHAPILPDLGCGGGRPGLLMVTSNFPRWPGDTTTGFVARLAEDLAERGWRVEVLAPHAAGAATRERLGEVLVHRFRYLRPDRAQTLCYGGGALVNLAGSPAAAAQVPALVTAELLAVRRLLATGRFAVAHSHWLLPQGFVTGVAARHRVPHLATVHGGDVFGLRGPALAWFLRRALLGADAVSVNSSATEAAVRALAPGLAEVHRIPMGVDPAAAADPRRVAELRQRYRRGAGPLIVFVGRIIEDKGVDDLVAAARLLLAGPQPDTTVALVGAGQHRDRLAAEIAASGLADRVHLPGWAQPAEVPSWLAAGDVVAAPSRVGPSGWTEAQGLSIAEALAAGRPVVATDVGGIADTVRDGVHGLLVPERDPAALAAAVQRLLADPALAARLAAAGQARVSAELSRQASADRFDQVLRGLLDRRRPAPGPPRAPGSARGA